MDKNYFIYILTNRRHITFYTGVTNDLIRRIYEHKNKLIDGFSKKYNLDQLVYFEQCNDVVVAIEREKQVKDYRRSKKLDLIRKINPELEDLYGQLI